MIRTNRLAKLDPNRAREDRAERKVLLAVLNRPVKLNHTRQYRKSRKMAAKIKQRFRNDQLQFRLLFRSLDFDDLGVSDFDTLQIAATLRSYRLLQQRHYISRRAACQVHPSA